eukprot:TRINITY_DN1018_c0_g1_i1.p1 TRINITY_DN1018_c0_g1~~TRINITY_DN1018_c0_g1_i1.p1  ORF type:complete len:171 (+),score=29.53 TRINITY_DN1018_c0_g1_i1:972-1484(+)
MADAGWMMDMNSKYNTPVRDQFKSGYELWQSEPNELCVLAYPDNPHYCLFSPYVFPYIINDVFVQTEQYDLFQDGWNCCSPPFNDDQLKTVEKIRLAFGVSLGNIVNGNSVAFSPACSAHCLSRSSSFTGTQVFGETMETLLVDWFIGIKVSNLIDDCPSFNCSIACPHN